MTTPTEQTLPTGVLCAELEPERLLQHFLNHPPVGFEAFACASGSLGFMAPFNLLTTADEEVVQRINRLPGARLLHRLLTWRTCFFGTTVSEYCPFPQHQSVAPLLGDMLRAWGRRSMLLIVKDFPDHSPLLSVHANAVADVLAEECRRQRFIAVEGQALAYVPIDFANPDEYLARLSSGRRRDIRRKLRARDKLRIEVLATGCAQLSDPALLAELYAQYEEVYAQSEIHFDLLSASFFQAILQDAALDGRVFMYYAEDRLIGYNICFVHNGMLVDKYVGFRYPAARDYNLYFVSWIENLRYACEHGLRYYVAGWTDPQIKSYLGASFTFTRHMVYVRNPLLRFALSKIAGVFESDRKWFEANANANVNAHAADS